MNRTMLLSKRQAAEQLGVSVATINRLIDADELVVVRIGRAVRVTYESTLALVERHTSAVRRTSANDGVAA